MKLLNVLKMESIFEGHSYEYDELRSWFQKSGDNQETNPSYASSF